MVNMGSGVTQGFGRPRNQMFTLTSFYYATKHFCNGRENFNHRLTIRFGPSPNVRGSHPHLPLPFRSAHSLRRWRCSLESTVSFLPTRLKPSSVKKRGIGFASVAVATALVFTGITGASASASPDIATKVTAKSASTCKTMKKVTVMMATTVLDVSYVPYGILAEELGYYKKMCLDVSFTINGSTISVEQALISNKADVGMISPDNLISAAETAPVPIKIFTNLIPKLIYNVAVPTDSKITKYSQLKGKTIGEPLTSALFNTYMTARLKDSGDSLDDIKLVSTGFGSAPMESLKSGAIDGFIAWPGLWASYRNAGYKFRLLPEATWQDQYYSIGLGTTNSYAKANPKVLAKISKGVVMTSKYLQKKANLEKAVRMYWADYPTAAPLPGTDEKKALKDDEAILTATIQEMLIDKRAKSYSKWGAQNDATWTRQIAFDIPDTAKAAELKPSDFYTNAYTAAANKK